VILLWGLTGDGPFDSVRAALDRRAAPYLLVDQRDVLRTGFELECGWSVRATVVLDGVRVPLDEVTAVYWRTYDVRRVPSVRAAQAAAADGGAQLAARNVELAMVSWLDLTEAMVVNRPSSMATNSSKPYQLHLLDGQGFERPRTLITTDPDEVTRFWTDSGAVIYKSISGTRSVVSRLTNAHLDRVGNVSWCPTQFQQFVPGRDVRVHVVGQQVFASEVVSDADDYRYAGQTGDGVQVHETTLPDQVAQSCLSVTRHLGMHLAGIDLRRAPDGRWFCFEVNPSPGFTYYESQTHQPIAAAIASLLSAERPAPATVTT